MFEWIKSLFNKPGTLYKAIDLIDDGSFQDAFNMLSPLVNKNIKKDLFYQSLARACTGLNRFNDAVVFAVKACELKPHNPANYGVLASAYMELKEFGKAMENIDMGLKIDSKNAYLHFIKGIAYLNLNEPDSAILHFQEFMAFNSSISLARIFTMCEAVLQNIRPIIGEYNDKTAQNFDFKKSGHKLKEHLGEKSFLHWNEGRKLLHQNKIDEATMVFEKLCKKNNSFVMARLLIVSELFFNENFKKSSKLFFK